MTVWVETEYGLVNLSAASYISVEDGFFEESEPRDHQWSVRVSSVPHGGIHLGPYYAEEAQLAYRMLKKLLEAPLGPSIVVPVGRLTKVGQ